LAATPADAAFEIAHSVVTVIKSSILFMLSLLSFNTDPNSFPPVPRDTLIRHREPLSSRLI
jgi:hypothetical protein